MVAVASGARKGTAVSGDMGASELPAVRGSTDPSATNPAQPRAWQIARSSCCSSSDTSHDCRSVRSWAEYSDHRNAGAMTWASPSSRLCRNTSPRGRRPFAGRASPSRASIVPCAASTTTAVVDSTLAGAAAATIQCPPLAVCHPPQLVSPIRVDTRRCRNAHSPCTTTPGGAQIVDQGTCGGSVRPGTATPPARLAVRYCASLARENTGSWPRPAPAAPGSGSVSSAVRADHRIGGRPVTPASTWIRMLAGGA